MSLDIPFDLPDILAGALDPFARGFGLNPSAATLLLLHMNGVVAGPSILTRTPDMVDATPAYDIAFIHDGRALLHGAAISAFEGARLEILEAAGAQESSARPELIEKRQKLQALNVELQAQIQAAEKVIASPSSPVETRGALERVYADARWDSDKLKLRAQISEWEKKLGEVQRQLVDLILVLRPGVIYENSNWREFVELGRNSFDGHFLQFAEAGPLLAETNSRGNRLKDCAELLRRSRSDSPISGFDLKDHQYRACVQISGTPEDFGALLRHSRIKSLGLLDSFVLGESDSDEPPDGYAQTVFLNHEWHGYIARQFRLRATGQRTFLGLDQGGCKSYFAFREWCREFNCQLPVEKRVHFLRWPELMVRIATSLAMIADETESEVLGVNFLESAASLLKDCAEGQAAVLVRLLDRKAHPARLDEGVERLVQTLRQKGPQSMRQLARGIHGMNYAVIDARLFAAIRRGLVISGADGRYWAAASSSTPSTELGATEKEGGLAA